MGRRIFEWEYYIFGPIVVVLVVAALWITVSAAYGNYRLAQATSQIIRVVDTSRSLKVQTSAQPPRAVADFFNRYGEIYKAEIQQEASAFVGDAPKKVLHNPWGGVLRVQFYPDKQAMRIETSVAAIDCRRLLNFYAKEVIALGLRRIDVRTDDEFSAWRLVYIEGGGAPELTPQAIYSGCGKEGKNLLSLTFSL